MCQFGIEHRDRKGPFSQWLQAQTVAPQYEAPYCILDDRGHAGENSISPPVLHDESCRNLQPNFPQISPSVHGVLRIQSPDLNASSSTRPNQAMCDYNLTRDFSSDPLSDVPSTFLALFPFLGIGTDITTWLMVVKKYGGRAVQE
ncbi:unnamed protein product [[Candida] boidinii]|nr:unnamed protein product [[Candida] boidinii]